MRLINAIRRAVLAALGNLWRFRWTVVAVLAVLVSALAFKGFWLKFLALTTVYVGVGALVGLGLAFLRPRRMARTLFADRDQARQVREYQERRGQINELRRRGAEINAQIVALPANAVNQPRIAAFQGELAGVNHEITRLRRLPVPPVTTMLQVEQRAERVGRRAQPVRHWWPRIAINNDWLFLLPAAAMVCTFMIATSRPAGEPLLFRAIDSLYEETVSPETEDKAKSAWQVFLYGDWTPTPATTPTAPERPGSRRTWFWHLSWFIYFLWLPLGAILAFHDEVTAGIHRVMAHFAERRREAAAAAPRVPGEHRGPGGGFFLTEGLIDFFAGFSAEYLANRAANRRLF